MQQPFQGLCTYSEPGGCNHHGADAAAKQNVIYDFAGLSMDGIQEAALAKGFTTANNGLVYVSFEDRKLPPDAQAGIKYPYVGTFHLRSLGANDDPADHEHNVLATATIPEDTVIAAGSSYTVDFGDCGSFEIQVQADSCALSFVEKTPLLFAGAPAGPTLTMTEAPGPRTDLILQIGDSSESYDKLVVELPDMDPAAIGVEGLYLGSADSAMASLQSLKDGINYVSEARGRMGAYQNRLEHTFDNLGIMSENIQDSESTIRDVDMADEMTAYSKNNILLQAAQAMLAQANQMPQGVLQLLQ
ncbi:MAG: hypothetical protein IKC24_08890 [Oscillospiraceae bacterium]|nr:hypothetical protein [Oscillospiraceae bacterium]